MNEQGESDRARRRRGAEESRPQSAIRRPGGAHACARLAGDAVVVTLLLAALPAGAQSLAIDTYTTDQGPLTLTFPPAGSTAGSSASGAGVLGGERDLLISLNAGVIAGNSLNANINSGSFSHSQDSTIAGSSLVQWDGADGSSTLNPTGLGGLDLTVGGAQNALQLSVQFDDLPFDVVMTIYTDAGNASTATFSPAGQIFAPISFVIPYSDFTSALGAGADFTNVGAITMSIGSNITAPDVVIDLLETTATVAPTKSVGLVIDVDGDGRADPGDTLEYTVMLSNPDDAMDAAAIDVSFTSGVDPNADLVVGSVTTSQGTVTLGNGAGDTTVAVDVGIIADGATVVITFQVTIDNPLPPGVTEVVCQGFVDSDTLMDVPTDNPDTPAPDDPTIMPVDAAPALTAGKTSALVNDRNGDGLPGPGDTLRYTIVIANTGGGAAQGVFFTDTPDAATELVVGSVSTTQGTVMTGNGAGDSTVVVNIGLIAGGGSVTIVFDVTIDDPLPAGTIAITNQGTVSGDNFPDLPTDNPTTPGADEPTVTPVLPLITEVPTLSEWGLLFLALLLASAGALQLRRKAT
jgi:uncharacterized repeat protein (TIGR01451 family)